MATWTQLPVTLPCTLNWIFASTFRSLHFRCVCMSLSLSHSLTHLLPLSQVGPIIFSFAEHVANIHTCPVVSSRSLAKASCGQMGEREREREEKRKRERDSLQLTKNKNRLTRLEPAQLQANICALQRRARQRKGK